jgi:lipopolysaccharide biosynthesis protein
VLGHDLETKIRTIAFYLPQYHPISENNAWWGKGFTEWTNVVKAKPLFKGHYQPQLPADLGFYDLRLEETRQAQADLARANGLYGFCYYHYWFNGKRLLERPAVDVLASGKPDFPFCFCWANENWTRRWDGKDREILMGQVYSEEDDLLHIRWLAEAFQDPRYIRVNGKPLFLVYRTTDLPNPQRTAEIWREEAHRLGVGELYLCQVESFPSEQGDPVRNGFDAAIEFQPDWGWLGWSLQRGWKRQLARRFGFSEPAYAEHRIYNYSAIVDKMLTKPKPSYKRYSCVTPAWDNSCRRKQDAIILHDSTPEVYEYWLRTVLQRTLQEKDSQDLDDRLVFINAWNEWGEGNHLEPCQKWGNAYLDATAKALESVAQDSKFRLSPIEV